jgi:hypothetical protein
VVVSNAVTNEKQACGFLMGRPRHERNADDQTFTIDAITLPSEISAPRALPLFATGIGGPGRQAQEAESMRRSGLTISAPAAAAQTERTAAGPTMGACGGNGIASCAP